MSIKQSIAALLVLFSVSFSANAFWTESYSNLRFPDADSVDKHVKETFNDTIPYNQPSYVRYTDCYFQYSGNSGSAICSRTDRPYDSSSVASYTWSGGEICSEDTVYNQETKQCDAPQYCSKQSTLDEIAASKEQCESSGKQFTYSCSNETETWEPTCQGGCDDVIGSSGDMTWDSGVFGSSLPYGYMCSAKGGGCAATIDPSSAWCGESGWCYASYTVLGPDCNSEQGNLFCNDPECKTFKDPDVESPTDTNPIHKPDDPTGEIFDPSPLPDDSTNTVPPKETEPEPEVEDPLTDPDTDLNTTDKAVVQAITGMNTDINSALNNLNTDINDNAVNIQNELIGLNASIVQNSQTIQEQQKNDNKIYENTKALIQQANADITTAVNKNTNAINALGDDVEAIGEGVAGIGESLDGLANLDLSGSLNGTCPYNSESESCTGYYEVGYPNGFEGLVGDHFAQLESEVTGIVDGMFALDVSNGSAPSFCMEVMQFGRHCFTDYFDLAAVFAFIRACMMFGTVMLCRKLVFGG